MFKLFLMECFAGRVQSTTLSVHTVSLATIYRQMWADSLPTALGLCSCLFLCFYVSAHLYRQRRQYAIRWWCLSFCQSVCLLSVIGMRPWHHHCSCLRQASSCLWQTQHKHPLSRNWNPPSKITTTPRVTCATMGWWHRWRHTHQRLPISFHLHCVWEKVNHRQYWIEMSNFNASRQNYMHWILNMSVK